jgi:hypothetical protein
MPSELFNTTLKATHILPITPRVDGQGVRWSITDYSYLTNIIYEHL